MKPFKSFIFLFALSFSLQNTSANELEVVHEFLPSPGGVGGHDTRNGVSLDTDQNRLIMGSGGDSHGNGGSATIFELENNVWIEQQTLRAPYDYEQFFGHSVAIQGNVAVVGAPKGYGSGYESGIAYVYQEFNGVWLLSQTIQSEDGDFSEFFGFSITIENNEIFIGSPKNDFLGTNVGAVEVFALNEDTWAFTEKLSFTLPTENINYSNFGYAIDSSNGRIVVSAPYYNLEEGIVFSFEKNNDSWHQTQYFQANDKQSSAYFGNKLSIDQNDLMISALNIARIGKVYFYQTTVDEWIETFSYVPENPAFEEDLGTSVSIHNDIAVAGARGNQDVGSNKGALYLFEKVNDMWSMQQKVYNPDFKTSSQFGRSTEVVGNDVIGSNSYGETYSFIKSGESWNASQFVSPNPGSPEEEMGRLTEINEQHAVILASDRFRDEPFYLYFFSKNELSAWDLSLKHEFEGVENSRGFDMSLDGNRLVLFGHDQLYIFDYVNEHWGLSSQHILPYVKQELEGDQLIENVVLNKLALHGDVIVSLSDDYINELSQIHVININNDTGEILTTLLNEFAVEPYRFFKDLAFIKDGILITPYVQKDANKTNVLKLYKFIDSQWSEIGVIESPFTNLSSTFGSTLAYDKNLLAIGDISFNSESIDESGPGAVHLYNYNDGNWVYEETIVPGRFSNNFGIELFLNGETLITKSVKYTGDTSDPVIHKFSKVNGSWSEDFFQESNYSLYDGFASDISGFRNQVLIGIPHTDYSGSSSGRATIYKISQNHQLSGSVTNLLPGNTIELNFNNREFLEVDQSEFVFDMELPENHLYDISTIGVARPFRQLCSVSNGQGVVSDEAVTDIEVVCMDFVDLIFEADFD